MTFISYASTYRTPNDKLLFILLFSLLFSSLLFGQNRLVKDEYNLISEKYVSNLMNNNSKITSLKEWKNLYHLFSNNSKGNRHLSIRALLRKARGEIKQAVPIGIIDFNSLFLKNKNKNSAREILLCAPLKDYSYTREVTFRFDEKYFFTENKNKIDRFEILNADDNVSQIVKFGDSFSTAFNSRGRNALRFLIVFKNDKIIKTGFNFIVRDGTIPPPDETWQLQADIAYDDTAATGEAYILFADQHTSLTNPIIVIEGYDPDSANNWPELYEIMNQENMIGDLLAQGYDAVTLNFSDAATFIQRNAFLVEKLIDTVNAVTGKVNENTVIGASMGGLVGRYALLDMENRGDDHNARLFISFDSPQKGADAPLGLQYFGAFFAAYVDGGDSLLAASDTPASKQMIVYHYADPPSTTGDPDPLFPALQNELASMGNYPQNLRKVAIINGSGTAQNQGYNAGDQIIQFDVDGGFLFHYRGNVWAVPDGNAQMIFDGIYSVFGGANDNEQATVGGTKPYDNAPGGFSPTMRELADGDTVFNAITALHDNHCFIPTVSSLALDTDDLFYNVDADPNILDLTPFDAIYYPDTNERHITITPATKQWFLDEITGTVSVELISFAAKLNEENILLYWSTATETNNKGFEIERALSQRGLWEKIGLVEGAGNSATTKEYSFVDNSANPTEIYFYRLKQIDYDGTYRYSQTIETTGTLPGKFVLYQNYPNPFSKASGGNATTIIKYSIPMLETQSVASQQQNFASVQLKIYDILGRETATLINEKQPPGNYKIEFNAKNLPSGIYIYTLRAGGFVQSKKMIFLR